MRGHAPADFEPHRLAEAAFAQLGLDGPQQIVGFIFLQIEIGVARDPETVGGIDLHSRKECAQVIRDEILEHDEPALTGGCRFDGYEAR